MSQLTKSAGWEIQACKSKLGKIGRRRYLSSHHRQRGTSDARLILQLFARVYLQVTGADCNWSYVQRIWGIGADEQKCVTRTVENTQIKAVHAFSRIAEVLGVREEIND